jgi:2-polyprenyl-3-methyl-5-hydroxy-6-metoxy-1,4-benzoquinol methylase
MILLPAFDWVKRLARPRGTFQPFGFTRPDRYPPLFRAAQTHLVGRETLRILSFGCATGEEIGTLRRHFPGASLKGIDINPAAIARARTTIAADFSVAASTEAEPSESYDAIFCLAVLRHGDLGRGKPARCDALIRFADFEHLTTDFARCLKPGGLLAIRHSNFRFEDTPAAQAFTPLLRAPRLADTPKYGRDDTRLPDDAREIVLWRKA